MIPKYNLDKIRFSVDQKTLERAVGLYENKKIKRFEENTKGYSAVVEGTNLYDVFISSGDFYHGNCDCYVSQKDELCKHMVAVAIYAVLRGEKINKDDIVEKDFVCSGKLGELNKEELAEVKKEISSAMKFIKAYTGSSKTWFTYTYSLAEGSQTLEYIFSKLPVSKQTSDLIIKTLLKLDDKLCRGGVDDSDGAVGNTIYGTVEILKDFSRLNKECIKSFEIFKKQKTCFGWEKDLVEILENN